MVQLASSFSNDRVYNALNGEALYSMDVKSANATKTLVQKVKMTADEMKILCVVEDKIKLFDTKGTLLRTFDVVGKFSNFQFDEWKLVVVGTSVQIFDIKTGTMLRNIVHSYPFELFSILRYDKDTIVAAASCEFVLFSFKKTL